MHNMSFITYSRGSGRWRNKGFIKSCRGSGRWHNGSFSNSCLGSERWHMGCFRKGIVIANRRGRLETTQRLSPTASRASASCSVDSFEHVVPILVIIPAVWKL